MAYLEGKNLVASYGVVPILHECSVEVEKGELAVIVCPNAVSYTHLKLHTTPYV